MPLHPDPSRAVPDLRESQLRPAAHPRPVARHPSSRFARSAGRLAVLVAVIGGAAAGCRHDAAPPVMAIRPMPYHPGGGLTGARVIVLPLETIRGGDLAGCTTSITSPRDFLVDANAQIARALVAKAPHTTWLLPADLAKTADKAAGYAPDPYSVDVSQLLPDRWKSRGEVSDPLASELRRLNSFTDAPVALIPVEIRFYPRAPVAERPGAVAPVAPGPGAAAAGCRPVLRVAVADTRALVIAWAGDVVGDSAATVSPGTLAALADRLAQAVATP
jgi:hypothetical protein